MKILALGDIHNRKTSPQWRIDNYSRTHFEKLDWAFNLGKSNGCKIAIGPGDIFHSPKSSDSTKRDFQNLLKKYNQHFSFLAVYGQHDIHHYNNNIENTPIGVVESSGLLKILSSNPFSCEEVDFYGSSWKEEIPKIMDMTKLNVLVIHRMIVKSENDKIWDGQTDCTNARTLLAKNDYDLIISGDSHQFFTSEYKGKTLLNMGSLMRSTSAQVDHKPTCAIFDTNTKTYTLHEVPIEPAEKVFNLEAVKKAKKHKEDSTKIREYVDILGGETETREWNFVGNLDNFIEVNKVRENVSKIIKSTLMA